MIKQALLKEAAVVAVRQGATSIPTDVEAALQAALARETDPQASGLASTLDSLVISRQLGAPACPDTGWPLFYLKVGNEAWVEGGMLTTEETLRQVVAEATQAGILRKTMKHPLTGHDPGTNIGENIPWFTYQFVPGETLELTYAAKGGGSEVFGGTRSDMIAFSDGLVGIKHFVMEAYIASARAGAVCPPGILGIGIGGTANVAANLAKEAACLRLVGSQHPDEAFANLERELCTAINQLGLGHMGSGGPTSVLAVHVEYAYTHIAGVAVATSTNCCLARRATVQIGSNGYQLLPGANWFGGR